MEDYSHAVLSALRLGSVPSVGLGEFAVGRKEEMDELERQLDVVARKGSSIKFLSGDYGVGKSFLCALFKERAFQLKFAASSVIISPDIPLGKMDIVMGRVFEGIRTSEKRTACALSDVLENWLFAKMTKTATLEGLNIKKEKEAAILLEAVMSSIEEELSTVHGLEASFSNVIKSYFRARMLRDNRLASDSLGWLRGSENISANRKAQFGVRGEITSKIAVSYLKGLINILLMVGYAGLVLIIDEVETVQRLPNSRQRENAYETIRVLVDIVAENAIPGLFLMITGTPRLFDDSRYGIPSYPALIERINRLSFPDGRGSIRQPIMPLAGFDYRSLIEVAKKVRAIHERALSWDSKARFQDEYIERLAEYAVSAFEGRVERTPRVFLREIVHLCDMLYEHPNLSAEEYFQNDRLLAQRFSASGK